MRQIVFDYLIWLVRSQFIALPFAAGYQEPCPKLFESLVLKDTFLGGSMNMIQTSVHKTCTFLFQQFRSWDEGVLHA